MILESEAKAKLCPMAIGRANDFFCVGSRCMAWVRGTSPGTTAWHSVSLTVDPNYWKPTGQTRTGLIRGAERITELEYEFVAKVGRCGMVKP